MHRNTSSVRDHLAAAAQPLCLQDRRRAVIRPVTLPPGRLKLATRPALTGSLLADEHDRDCRGCGLGRQRARFAATRERSRPPGGEPDQRPTSAAVRIRRAPSGIRSPRSGPRQIPAPSDPRAKRHRQYAEAFGRSNGKKRRPPASPPAARAPRAASSRRAAEKRDELAPPHSITSSARASSVGGT